MKEVDFYAYLKTKAGETAGLASEDALFVGYINDLNQPSTHGSDATPKIFPCIIVIPPRSQEEKIGKLASWEQFYMILYCMKPIHAGDLPGTEFSIWSETKEILREFIYRAFGNENLPDQMRMSIKSVDFDRHSFRSGENACGCKAEFKIEIFSECISI